MFKKVLIANRGEIACRVAATCRALGILTVAVYSDADANAKHVAVCDEAVHLGGAAPQDSYLRFEKIIAVALHTGAQAIHPGYGFLSENAQFATACEEAGLVFVGPPPGAIHAMGLKAESKRLMAQAGVPLVPGYHGANQNAQLLAQEAQKIGYPVLLKASAGGGGKGMRVVEKAADFATALASCQREAQNSFGDAAVLIEKYLVRPRHIEIQIFADSFGHCVYLFERDCTVQRRHQKVLEEAPAPNLPQTMREAMGRAAIAAAKAVGYVGAGTVEFIVAPHGIQDGTFYFMEMNTRLQVEHPVTEMITGLDLVALQLSVASGQPLPMQQSDLRLHGHALEARVYAENPDKQFLPTTGTLRILRSPAALTFNNGNHLSEASCTASVRIDSGVREGDTISPHYDPMIAKLIVWGNDRTEALAKMRQALAEFVVVGVTTNISFLQRLIACPAFANAHLSAHADLDAALNTGLIEQNLNHLCPAPIAPSLTTLALACAALLEREAAQQHTQQRTQQRADKHSPWAVHHAWQLNSRRSRTLVFSQQEGEETVPYSVALVAQKKEDGQQTWSMTHAEQTLRFSYHIMTNANAHAYDDKDSNVALLPLQLRGEQTITQGIVAVEGAQFHIFCQGQSYLLRWHDAHTIETTLEGSAGKLTAPMPGKIIAVHVRVGDTVQKGQILLVMEAMKMEHSICAPRDGVVAQLLYTTGEQVDEGVQLLTLTPLESVP